MRDYQSEATIQIYGRLTAHEFMLEILLSQFLAQFSQEQATSFAAKIVSQMRTAWTADDADSRAPEDAALRAAHDAQLLASRLLEKALERAGAIRAK